MSDLSSWLNRPYFTIFQAAYLLDGQIPDNNQPRPESVANWQDILSGAISKGAIEPYYPTERQDQSSIRIKREALIEFAEQHGITFFCAETEKTVSDEAKKIPSATYPTVYGIIGTLWRLHYGDVNMATIQRYKKDCEEHDLKFPSKDEKDRAVLKALRSGKQYLK